MKVRELNELMRRAVQSERMITNEVLRLINLCEDQKLFLEMRYPSLVEWLVVEHKYSDRAARRRVSAAKLLRAVPEVASKIADGSVNLTNLARAQSLLNSQEIKSGEKVSEQERRSW